MSAETSPAAAPKQASLYFTDGRSDKEYHAKLETSGGGWVVNFAYGRRGASLTTGTKTSSPVSYEKALKVFDGLVKEKTAKGYVPDEAGRPFSVGDASGRKSDFLPQLSNPIDIEGHALDAVIDGMIASDEWYAQQKHDGVRMAIEIFDDGARGINRRGLFVDLPPAVAAAYALHPVGTLVDGELVGDVHHAFDVVRIGARSLMDLPFRNRIVELDRALRQHSVDDAGAVRFVPAMSSFAEKRELRRNVEGSNGEGLVFKRASAVYRPGRPARGGDSIKLKFWESATVRVAGVNAGKRSVSMEMLDGKGWSTVGNVTVPSNQEIPAEGSLIEVRYLYAMLPSKALFQPVLLGSRADMELADCSVSQLKFKAEPEIASTSLGPSMG